jgi:hypothetical protein
MATIILISGVFVIGVLAGASLMVWAAKRHGGISTPSDW